MKPLALIALAAVTGLGPVTAVAWTAHNRHEVYALPNGQFEVVSEVGTGAAQYWCGAGDFAKRRAGAPGNARIYLARGIGPSLARPGRKAVRFSLSPPPGGDTGQRLTLSVSAVGDNLNAPMAQQYCYGDDPFDLLRLWP